MRGDADVAAGFEQRLERVDEALLHRVEVAELDLARLDVDALAEADVRLQVGELADVGDRALQRRLQHDADGVIASVT